MQNLIRENMLAEPHTANRTTTHLRVACDHQRAVLHLQLHVLAANALLHNKTRIAVLNDCHTKLIDTRVHAACVSLYAHEVSQIRGDVHVAWSIVSCHDECVIACVVAVCAEIVWLSAARKKRIEGAGFWQAHAQLAVADIFLANQTAAKAR